jgi:hypothetical protein
MFGRRPAILATVGALAVCALAAGTARAATSTLEATADAAVSAAAPTTRLGNSSVLGTALAPETRSYIRFDVNRVATPVLSALLSVYALNAGDGFEVRAVAQPNAWSEGRVTWSNAPPPGPTMGNFSPPVNGPGWITVDVTDIVAAAASLHQPAEMVLLAGGPHANAYVSRKGDHDRAPRLVVSNDIMPPAISITSPVDLTTSHTAKATITGVAGTAPGDSSTVTVEIFAGEDTSAAPLQTITTKASRSGAFSVTTRALAPGEYTADATQADADGNVATTGVRFWFAGP